MFGKYIKEDSDVIPEKEEERILGEEQPYEFPIPKSMLPWKNNPELITEYTQILIDAGFSKIELIASSNIEELERLTGLPKFQLVNLLKNAQNWSMFNFESAASLYSAIKEAKRISTGCKGLDNILGGGIETKSITEIYGEFITGKSQICLQLAVNTALAINKDGLGGKVIYMDTEGSFSPERVMQLCKRWEVDPSEILENILVGRAYTTDLQIMMVDNIIKTNKDNEIKLIIIDSLTSNFRSEYIGTDAIIDRQQKLNKHIQQLNRIADIYQIAIVVTNQVLSSMGKNELRPVGGNILAHGSTHRIECTKIEGRKSVRKATMVASPSLPRKSALFKITGIGIEDV